MIYSVGIFYKQAGSGLGYRSLKAKPKDSESTATKTNRHRVHERARDNKTQVRTHREKAKLIGNQNPAGNTQRKEVKLELQNKTGKHNSGWIKEDKVQSQS